MHKMCQTQLINTFNVELQGLALLKLAELIHRAKDLLVTTHHSRYIKSIVSQYSKKSHGLRIATRHMESFTLHNLVPLHCQISNHEACNIDFASCTGLLISITRNTIYKPYVKHDIPHPPVVLNQTPITTGHCVQI
jgi:hypothetical protein